MNYCYQALSATHRFLAKLLTAISDFLAKAHRATPVMLRVAILFLLLAGINGALLLWSDSLIARFAGWVLDDPKLMKEVDSLGYVAIWNAWMLANRWLIYLLCASALLALLPLRIVPHLLRLSVLAFLLLWGTLFWVAYTLPSYLCQFSTLLELDSYTREIRNEHWQLLGIPWLLLALVPLYLIVELRFSSTLHYYTGRFPERPTWADRFAKNIRTGGDDPRMRSSTYWAVSPLIVYLLIVILLWFIGLFSSELTNFAPAGQGDNTPPVVTVRKKVVKKEVYVINPLANVKVSLDIEDDSTILDELEDDTSNTYTANSAKGGGIGAGGPGEGGWPSGTGDGAIAMIRLEHGGDWDLDMGRGRDHNLLLEIHKRFNQIKVEKDTQSVKALDLKRYRSGAAPKFLLVCGRDRDLRLSASEQKAIYEYCAEEGGMLFIIASGPAFGRSVAPAMRRIFKNLDFVVIPKDDPIYHNYYSFPNGAPILWHMAGTQAMGIKHNGQWVAFYHPGDLNNGWEMMGKTADLKSRRQAEICIRMGINVLLYAYNKYHYFHQSDKK